VLAMLLAASLSVADTPKTATAKPHLKKQASHHVRSHKRRPRGQQGIDGQRARQIQEALIREHYLKGQPSGKWDPATQQAMQHYQADQGWQSKNVPDSRALIRLGLGPDNQHLLNPESAMTTAPVKQNSASTKTASSAAAASVAPASASADVAMPAAPVSAPSSGMTASPTR